MDSIRHALNVSQRAPLPLVAALAVSTIVGLVLLVRGLHKASRAISSPLLALPRPIHRRAHTTTSPGIRENIQNS